jgi:hypothetical protein
MRRVIVRYRAFAGNRFRQRNATLFGEIRQRLLGAGIAHAAARDDERPRSRSEDSHRLGEPVPIWPRPGNRMHFRLEEGFRIVPRHLLHILRQRDESRSAIGGVEQNADCLRQRGDDLLGMDDAIPIARDRFKSVVDVDGGIAEVLHLLHDRIGSAIDEGVARQKQHGQPVRMGHACSRYHVQRAGADGSRRDHHLATALRLRETDGSERH